MKASGSTYISGDSGRVVLVSIEEGKVNVGPLKAAGTYEGKTKLREADTAIVMKVRDFWLWPLLPLVVGVWAAVRMENYFTRSRPSRHLAYVLGTLQTRTLDAQVGAKERLDRFASPGTFAADVLFVPGAQETTGASARGYLPTRARQLLEGFNGSLADFERERFGPASDAVKDLDMKVSEFTEHLATTVELARVATDLGQDPDGDIRKAFLTRVSAVLSKNEIQDRTTLDRRVAEMKALLTRLTDVRDLARQIRNLRDLAEGHGLEEQVEQAEALYDDVFAGVDLSPGGELKVFRDGVEKLHKDIEEPPSETEERHELRRACGDVPSTSPYRPACQPR